MSRNFFKILYIIENMKPKRPQPGNRLLWSMGEMQIAADIEVDG
jgi:hypothetical protein